MAHTFTRADFELLAEQIANRQNWTLDLVDEGDMIAAWFSERHPNDAPGRPFGADAAQAYMRDGDAPVGIVELAALCVNWNMFSKQLGIALILETLFSDRPRELAHVSRETWIASSDYARCREAMADGFC